MPFVWIIRNELLFGLHALSEGGSLYVAYQLGQYALLFKLLQALRPCFTGDLRATTTFAPGRTPLYIFLAGYKGDCGRRNGHLAPLVSGPHGRTRGLPIHTTAAISRWPQAPTVTRLPPPQASHPTKPPPLSASLRPRRLSMPTSLPGTLRNGVLKSRRCTLSSLPTST